MKRISALVLVSVFALPVLAKPAKLIAVCSVSEVLPDGRSATTDFKFDGTQQANHFKMSLTTGVDVEVRGSAGSDGDYQAFVIVAILSDSTTGIKQTSEAYFTNGDKYSERFATVIRGSLILHYHRPNQEVIQIDCFNPQT